MEVREARVRNTALKIAFDTINDTVTISSERNITAVVMSHHEWACLAEQSHTIRALAR